ncbi:MAG: phage tail protein [Alphaproteobacteria bacterium]|nr:MAG: phage tail protein [Alphaproteobacteria bacterium]
MNGTVLMTLGDIRFSVEEGAYNALSRSLEIRVARIDRAGRQAARQVLGEDETIDIEGSCYPGQRHGRDRVDSFRVVARTYQPQMLTDGTGAVWGEFVIERVEERGSQFTAEGIPLRQDFRLTLGAYGADAPAEVAAPAPEAST